MGRIRLLSKETANGIAAGEVVERPSSVVKELMENAMDAGATVITVEIEGGGISLIRITDDGCGMDEEDAKQAFQCHATSKIESLEDLFSLHTMGFRGEALSSISATSRVLLRTRQPGSDMGTEVAIEAGNILRVNPAGCPSGTSIEVRDLFYNMPARYKFMKKDLTEAQYITTLCERFSMIRPDISFRLINQGKEILHTPGNNDSISSLYCIYGKQIVDQCIPMDEQYGELHISGFAGKTDIAKSTRGEQTIFVNDRLIRSKTISYAIDEAYKTMLMKGRYAFIILSIRVPSLLVDVNVHPQKAEVRFWNDSEVFRALYHVIHNALLSSSHVIEPHAHALFGLDGKDTVIVTHTNEADDSLRQIEVSLHRPPEYVYPIQSSILEVTDGPKRFREEMMTEVGTQASVMPPHVSDTNRKDDFKLDSLLHARFIGIAFATYILLEADHFLILLDQHAAHEKIIFEALVKDYTDSGNKSMHTQPILVPVIMSMTPADLLFLEEMSESIHKAGFRFEPIGEQEIILREIPNIPQTFHPADTFRSFVDSLKRVTPKTDEEILLHLATSACKAAVKGHDRLDDLEVHALLEDLSKLENPYHCPHGRPIIIRLFQKDLEKEFKRIV